MLDHLKSLNPHVTIHHISDSLFLKYGRIIKGYDFSECLEIMQTKLIPEEGNCYIASDNDMTKTKVVPELSQRFYGSMPIQIGYCNGNNSKLNALEYHKGSEIDVAATDLVLILSDIRNIKNNSLNSSCVDIFYVPQNTACELYATTLHFAPCKTCEEGFKSIIILPEGTNAPLDTLPTSKCDEDNLLWMQNKWLIAHSESIPASKGAFVGIVGENIEIKY